MADVLSDLMDIDVTPDFVKDKDNKALIDE